MKNFFNFTGTCISSLMGTVIGPFLAPSLQKKSSPSKTVSAQLPVGYEEVPINMVALHMGTSIAIATSNIVQSLDIS